MRIYLSKNEEYSLYDENFTISTNPKSLEGNIYYIECNLEKGLSFEDYWDTFQPYTGEFDNCYDLEEELADKFGYEYPRILEVIKELGYQNIYFWVDIYSEGKLIESSEKEFDFDEILNKCIEKLEEK